MNIIFATCRTPTQFTVCTDRVRATGKTTDTFYRKNADLRADEAGYNTPFAGVLQLLALPSWHCHHQCPAAFSLDTCISLTNTAETHPRWGAITALVHPPSYLSFWSRFGAISGGKVETWMCLPRGGACLPTNTHLCKRMDALSRGLCICLSAASNCKLEPQGFLQSCSTAFESHKALLGSCLLWQSWSLKVGLYHSNCYFFLS